MNSLKRNLFPVIVGTLLVVFVSLIAFLYVEDRLASKVRVEINSGQSDEIRFVYRRDSTNTNQLHDDMQGLVDGYKDAPFSFEIELGCSDRHFMSAIISTYRVEYTSGELTITELHMDDTESLFHAEMVADPSVLMEVLPMLLAEIVSNFRRSVHAQFLEAEADSEIHWYTF